VIGTAPSTISALVAAAQGVVDTCWYGHCSQRPKCWKPILGLLPVPSMYGHASGVVGYQGESDTYHAGADIRALGQDPRAPWGVICRLEYISAYRKRKQRRVQLSKEHKEHCAWADSRL
jgi:hypothetical protein